MTRLDKLRGFGPWFAFATPVFFLLAFAAFIIITSSIKFTGSGNAPAVPDWFGFGVAVWLILLALTMLSGLVVALDLEWIEHPRTHTGLTYVGLGAMAVSTLAFLLTLVLATFFGGWWTSVTVFFFFAGLGIYLLVMNWVALRAHLWGPALPWLGMVAGGLWVLVSIGYLGFLALALLPAVPLYLAWSIWLGFKLRAPAPAAAATATQGSTS